MHLVAVATTTMTAQAAVVVAQAATSGDVPAVIGYGVQGGSALILGLVVRALLAGRLVVRQTAEIERQLREALDEAHARERVYQVLVEQRQQRQQRS